MKENELEKLEELRKTIESSPLTQQIITENADKVLRERLLAAAKLRAAIEEGEKVIPERQQDVDALVAELNKYDKGRSVILDKLTAARVELGKARQSLEWERSHAEAALLSNYDRSIDEAIVFFRDRIEGLLVKHINTQQRTGKTNIFTEKQEVFIYSNAAAIKKALAYCRAAIGKLEGLKLRPDLDAERIEGLRKGIPDADELTENIGERETEKGPSGAFLSKMRQEADDRIDKLLRKRI